jgi:hypothetical protein
MNQGTRWFLLVYVDKTYVLGFGSLLCCLSWIGKYDEGSAAESRPVVRLVSSGGNFLNFLKATTDVNIGWYNSPIL